MLTLKNILRICLVFVALTVGASCTTKPADKSKATVEDLVANIRGEKCNLMTEWISEIDGTLGVKACFTQDRSGQFSFDNSGASACLWYVGECIEAIGASSATAVIPVIMEQLNQKPQRPDMTNEEIARSHDLLAALAKFQTDPAIADYIQKVDTQHLYR